MTPQFESSGKKRILIVEDEVIVAMNLRVRLPELGYEVVGTVADGREVVKAARQLRPDLVLMDIRLSEGTDGIDAAQQLTEELRLPVVYLTSYADDDTLRRAKLTEPFGYVLKPFGIRELHATIEMALYRFHMQEQLRESREWLMTTLNSIGEGVMATDHEGRIRFMNPVAEQLTGWDQQEALGQDIDTVFPLLDAAGAPVEVSPAKEALATGTPCGESQDFFMVNRQGGRIPIVDGASPIKGGRGEVIGVVISFRDMTERKRMQERLAEQDRHKDEFLAILAHELRNPLAPMRNAVEILKQQGKDPEVLEKSRDFLDRQVRHMARLVDELLDVSRISQGKLVLVKQRFELGGILRETVDNIEPQGQSCEVRLHFQAPEQPVHVEADAVRLAEVFQNLILNACKYTLPGGSVFVELASESSDVVVRVRDTGVGIAPDQLGRVFDVFTQVEGSKERSQGGLGIGLFLSKRIVELHGGTLTAFSAGLGKGSEFTVRLPLAPAASNEAPEQRPETAAVNRPRRILLADDHADNLQSMAFLLQLEGHEVEMVSSGQRAVEKARDWKPDVVLLDIGMPGMDGYEACRAIRQQEGGRDMVILALTGWGQEEDRRKSAEAGFEGHLLKPVDPAVLRTLLRRERL